MKYITRIIIIFLSISLVTFIIITINIDNSIKRLEEICPWDDLRDVF